MTVLTAPGAAPADARSQPEPALALGRAGALAAPVHLAGSGAGCAAVVRAPRSVFGGRWLGDGVNGLGEAMAEVGNAVHLFFVGDPDRPGVETRGGVQPHRWSQGISAEARSGVYADGAHKIEDLCAWLPDHLSGLIADGRDAGLITVVLVEEWQMAWPLLALHDHSVARDLRPHAVLAWHANNRFGFERLDFGRLAEASVLLTVSKAMKHLMWRLG